jgi:XapX domain-containing protein
MDLKPYIISLAIGLLVGVIYALLNTRSPAPPIIALLGLLGMLVGESLTSWAKSQMSFAKAAEHCLHAKDFSASSSEEQKTAACDRPAA